MNRWRPSGTCLALAMLLAVALPALAQTKAAGTVSGTVVDESGAALPGANVQLSGPGVNKFETTGGDGTFSFTGVPAGTYKLSLTLIGFGSALRENVTATEGGTVQVPPVTLKIALRGEEVVVTASKIESSLVNAPVTMSVVTSDTIENSPAQNYGDLLRSVPGLNVIQTSARDINITSRQATSTLVNSQLTLLDGRSIYLDFFGLTLWDLVPAASNEIKQIEVVRGPASAVWGANALTGVVNIITKTPREAEGLNVVLTGGIFDRDAGSTTGQDMGKSYGANFSFADAPNDRWSYKIAAGYYSSDPYARPVGFIGGRVGADGRCQQIGHPYGPSLLTGCAPYPADKDPSAAEQGRAFQNTSTSQPKVDLRVDQEVANGGRITYSGGYAGTDGIIHTGIGPFDIQSGSYMGYGRVAYTKGAWKAALFANLLDVDAPNLLLVDPATNRPVPLTVNTQTYDVELGHSNVVAERHILTYGGNARRNQFDITLAPNAEDRNEFGAYFQDEIYWDKFRVALGARVDKFGNIDDPVFSPRVSLMFKPAPAHSIRLSYNRAFRAPSAINNFLDQAIFAPTLVDLRPLAGLAPPALRPALSQPFALRVNNVGNPNLKEESLTAYELAYSGTFNGKTSVGIALYQNDSDDNINFTQITPNANFPQGLPGFDVYTPANAPAVIGVNLGGVPVPGAVVGLLLAVPPQFGGPIRLPRTVATYLNLGPLRQRGIELSIDHAFNRTVSAFANYSWQDDPEILDADSDQVRYPIQEVTVPAKSRVNAGINVNHKRYLGSIAVNYSDKAFWTDVLSAPFHGFTDAYTMVNASVGAKWMDGKVVTAVKVTNLTNEDIQQHVFGDIMKRSIVGELKISVK